MASERDWKKPVKVLKGFKKVGIDVKTPQDEVDMEGETSSSSSSSTFVNYCAMDGTVISKSLKSPLNPFVTNKRKLPENFFKHEPKRCTLSPASNFYKYSQPAQNSVYSAELCDPESFSHRTSSPQLDEIYLDDNSIQQVLKEWPLLPNQTDKFDNTLPEDWTLKRKARFLSPTSFSWCQRFTGNEEDDAIKLFTSPSTLTQEFINSAISIRRSKHRTELLKELLYYEYPMVECQSTFPRYNTEINASSILSVYSPRISSKNWLYDSWMRAFKSAFQGCINKRIPYFYVNSQEYTAVFRNVVYCNEGVKTDETECILTPASKGMRAALQKEGVVILDPSVKLVKLNPEYAGDSYPVVFDEEGEKEDSEGEVDDPSVWDDVRSSVSMDHNSKSSYDETVLNSSVILVRGKLNLQLLYNYLLNCKNSIATSGLQALLPPTILSPLPFKGGTMMSLSFKQGLMKTGEAEDDILQTGEAGNDKPRILDYANEKQWGLDVTGPIMPHHRIGLVTLLNRTQKTYTAAFSTYHNTGPFNNVERPSEQKEENIETGYKLLRKLYAKNGSYKWSS